MLRFEVSKVMWDPIGAENGERERDREHKREMGLRRSAAWFEADGSVGLRLIGGLGRLVG